MTLSEQLFKAARLCVVGNINRDLKTAPFLAGPGLLQDGETPVASIVETVGGGGANSAFAAAALGAKVAFVGKVGADALGDKLARRLAASGISAFLARDPARPTGTSLALTFADGHRHFVSCHPNNESLTSEDLDLRALDGFDHLFRADIWFSRAMLFGGNERLFRAARAAGLATSIDLNWDPQWGVAGAEAVQARKQAVRDVLPWVNLAHGNRRELNEFAGSDDLMTSLRRLEEWGVEAVVAHLGADGAGYYQRGHLTVEPAVPASRQVNSTGTGDVLSVCMMLLHQHPDVAGKLRLANRVVADFIEGKRQFIPLLD
jgi:sugar/nucleoside kinase (ribokinase family)